ncbi:MAG: hypothetical protein COA58_08080 [Bacteroidetes bacterium]|nr:MAG: hypothetical protein COA58_08080 [Bacteroidota bacterium]
MEELDSQKTRVYWILTNIRKGIASFIKNGFKKRPIVSILITLVLVYLIFVSRGSLQPFFLLIRKYILLIALIILVLWRFSKGWSLRSTGKKVLTTVLLIGFAAGSYLGGPEIYRYISLYFHYSSINKVALDKFPTTNFERIQPINSVKTLINQEALSETEDATRPNFVRGVDGKYYYSCAVGPAREYKIQQMTKNMYEIIHVPADLPAPVFSKKYRDDVNFNIGELLLFSKKTSNAIIKKFGFFKYFTYEPAEPIYLQQGKNKWLQVIPLIRWKGIIFPRPVFGGVYLIEEMKGDDGYFDRVLFGKGKYIAPEDIKNHYVLAGQNLLPQNVAEFTAESFKFSSGFLAPMPFYHQDDIRIPDLPNDVNPQPFITYFNVNGKGKIYNFYGLEPYQQEKKSLSLSLFIAGDNDDTVYFLDHRKRDQSYIGSSAISAKIIESKKNYDWSKNYPAETRPFVRTVNGESRFMWLSTIVTKAGENKDQYIAGSIPEITLTDAIHGKVVWIDQDSLINNDTWIEIAKNELEDYWEKE